MFTSRFSVTDPRPQARSAFAGHFSGFSRDSIVGVYGHGLLTVTDAELGGTLLAGWSRVVGERAMALAVTAFGDVFFADDHGIKFLEIQRRNVVYVDSDADWFLDEFLTLDGIAEDVLRSSDFDQVRTRLGPLSYGEAYVLRPWRILGGFEDPQLYDNGSCATYLELVSRFTNNRDR